MLRISLLPVFLAAALGVYGAAFAAYEPEDTALLAEGRAIYAVACADCHGIDGDGVGPRAEEFTPRPRDFTLANFKFRSTGFGELPSEADIDRTIRNGIVGRFGRTMPSFSHLTARQRLALIEVVRVFGDLPELGQSVRPPPRPLAADLNRGRMLYDKLSCAGCHGENGDGNGVLTPNLRDDDGLLLAPASFVSGEFKGGGRPIDLWMRLDAGLDGTPMPSFGRNNDPNDLWALVEYVLSFKK